MRGDAGWSFLVAAFAGFGFFFGYHWPRDVELESTKPIALHFEVTPEAEKTLILRAVEGFPKCETEEGK